MKSVVAVFLTILVGCGGSTKSGAFVDDIDASTTQSDSAATETSITPTTDADEETTPTTDSTTTDTAKPTMDAPAPGCPAGMTAEPTKCPEICNGGCIGDTCKISCGISACGGRRIDCPPGMKCLVSCSGASSCGGLDMRCAETGACALQCSGPNSCGGVQLRCPSAAPCSINCGGLSACGGGQVACGKGACLAECTGVGASLSKVDCGSSCMCTNKC